MFSKLLDKVAKRTDVRLTVQFSTIFVLTSLALFMVSYVLLSSSLARRDGEELRARFREIYALYQLGGMRYISSEIRWEEQLGTWKAFFVRVSDQRNRRLLYIGPAQWQEYDLTPLTAASRDGQLRLIRLRSETTDYELSALSVQCADGNLLQVGLSTRERYILLRRFRSIFSLALLPLFSLGFIGGLFSTHRLLKPIRNITRAARSIIDTGKMDARVSPQGTGDELDELTQLFNTMLAKIETLITGMREALDNVAHDLRTPLTRVRGVAEIALQSRAKADAYRDALGECIEESEHILTMLNTLTDISEAETGVMRLDIQRVDLAGLAAEVAELYQYIAEEKGIDLSCDLPAGIEADVNSNRMRQVLANIIDNAVKYTQAGGSVTVRVSQSNKQAEITVVDTGIGIAPEELPSIWDRLYRGQKSRTHPGLGLGLSIVKAYAQAHDGRVEVSSEIGAGSRFTIVVPQTRT